MGKYQRKFFALVTAALLLIPPGLIVQASSHREAPSITLDPTADNTDLYVFRSTETGRSNSVTMITNFIPLEEPSGGPNFHKFDPNVLYEIMIDNNGDTREDITYQFRFQTQVLNNNTFLNGTGPITSLTDTDYNVRQTYTVTRVIGNRRFGVRETLGSGLLVPPPNFGPATTPNYEGLADAAVQTLSDGSRVFAGSRDEGFYVDLGAIFDLLQLRKLPGNAGGGVDGTGGYNVHSIALEVPISRLTRDGSVPVSGADPAAVIGVWSTASRPFITILPPDGGPPEAVNFPFGFERWIQVSRLGNPLVNEVVIPLAQKDRFNASHPIGDGQFLSFVTNPELATLLNLVHGVPVPPAPRNDLVAVFLTGVSGLNQPPNVVPSEQMRLNVAIPPTADASRSRLGVLAGDLAGFPNGRRVGDDVVDIALRAVAGVLVGGAFAGSPNKDLGDGVDQNDVPYLTKFPYLGTPQSGKSHTHHREEPAR